MLVKCYVRGSLCCQVYNAVVSVRSTVRSTECMSTVLASLVVVGALVNILLQRHATAPAISSSAVRLAAMIVMARTSLPLWVVDLVEVLGLAEVVS